MIYASSQKAWTIGQKFCVDEAMIKYKGCAIKWVQYMPAKPIKHGIKVYAFCCSFTGFLYDFEIFTGTAVNLDNSAVAVVARLLSSGNF